MALSGRQLAVGTAVLGGAGVVLPVVAARAYDAERAWRVAHRAASLAWDSWPFRISAALFVCSVVVAVGLGVIQRLVEDAAERRLRASRRASRPPPRKSAPPPIDGAAPAATLAALAGRAATQRLLTIDAPTIDNLGLSATGRRRVEELLAQRGVILVVCRDRLLGTQAARVIDGLRAVGRAMVVFAEDESTRAAVEGAASRAVVVAVHGRSAEGVLRQLRSRAPVLHAAAKGVVEITMFPRLCGMCTHPRQLDRVLVERASKVGLDLSERVAYRGEGCDVCKGTGRRGGAYVAIVSPVDEAVASMNRAEELLEWIEKGWLGVDDVVEGLSLHAG